MHRIDVDEAAQTSWADKVRQHHPKVRLEVEDLSGDRHSLLALSDGDLSYQPFDGEVAQFWLSGSGRATRWPHSSRFRDPLHVQVDGRGQLEVWSGHTPVAKVFDADASPAEWCPGLIHVEASKVRDLDALLACEHALTLESIDLGGSESFADLSPISQLKRLRSLYLNSCHKIVDLTPLSALRELEILNLALCYKVRDLSPLTALERLHSIDLHECEVSDISPLAGLPRLTSLNLQLCFHITDIGPLRHLTALRSLDLYAGPEVADLSPLAAINGLTRVGLSLNDATREPGLLWLSKLHDLNSLELGSDGEGMIELAPISGLRQLRNLHFHSPSGLEDLRPLERLSELHSLTIDTCKTLRDISPLASLAKMTRLSLRACRNLSDLGPLGPLVCVKSLDLEDCESVADLEPLRGMSQLQWLKLKGCKRLEGLSPIAGLTQLSYLNLHGCTSLSNTRALAGLTKLTELDLGWTNVKDLEPLTSLEDLRSLNLSLCDRVSDVRPLARLKKLASLEMGSCERLALVSPLAELPSLSTLDLFGCANIRDADALCESPSLRSFDYEESATRAFVLLACATRRGDAELQDRAITAAASFELSKSPGPHAIALTHAVEALTKRPELSDHVLRDIVAAIRGRGEVPPTTWQKLFSAIAQAPDPTSRPAFEVALADLPLADSERVLAPALLALSEVCASAKDWALKLAQQALGPVAASAPHAREVAPAAAVFFHAHGLAGEVSAWLERGSVAQAPAWRDRVLVALLGRALRAGEIPEARRLLNEVQTPERRDEARALLVQSLSSRAEFRDAAADLDAIVDRAVRASAAADALRQAPAWAAEPQHGLSLLLALDSDPDTLAEVLSAMIRHAPDSELVQQLAAVFAPAQGADLAESVDALLGHPSVAERTKRNQLAALRARIGADAAWAQRALVEGTAALLEAEGLVDQEERAEIVAALLEEQT